jgi:20S proteasome subunit alpha 5
LAAEKRLTSILLDPHQCGKDCELIRALARARTLVEHARVEAQNHTFTYDEKIDVEAVTQAVCDLGKIINTAAAATKIPLGAVLRPLR